MRIQALLLILATVAFWLFALPGSSQETEKQEVDMRKKLAYSQLILDGLVTEDFDKILEGAKSLNQLGKQKWIENDSVEYRTQNQVFWFTTGSLMLAAEEKNIDSATLSYTQMMHGCVNCHKVIRRK
jgi:hypothetical protein